MSTSPQQQTGRPMGDGTARLSGRQRRAVDHRMLTAENLTRAAFTTGDQVVHHDQADPDCTDRAIAVVRQIGSSPNMPAEDWDMILVAWSRSTLRWEYAEDFRPA